MKTRIQLVEDHELIRAGLRLALESDGEFEVVAEAEDYATGAEQIRENQPDILVLDIELPDGDGLDLLNVCHEHSPDTRVLVLSGHRTREWADRALDAGCCGYVDKTAGIGEIAPAVRSILRGRTVVSVPSAARQPGRQHASDPPHAKGERTPHLPTEQLSPRESEVLKCLARGLTNQQAADQMFLSVKTIETYRSRLTRKLGLSGRSELFDYALAEGLISSSCSANAG